MTKTRYDELIDWVKMVRPRSIVEVGAWNGRQAVRMIRAAQSYSPQVTYTGYDLFELGSDSNDDLELNGKSRVTQADTSEHINTHCPDAIVELVRGNTKDTLAKKVQADFVFIDGGHSVETIENDYRACEDCSVVLFDDYYFDLNPTADIDTDRFGCNTLIDQLAASNDPNLSVGLLPVADHFDHLGSIGIAFVVRAPKEDQTLAVRALENLLVMKTGKEFAFTSPTREEVITAVYKALLGQPPSAAAMADWVNRIDDRGLENFIRDVVNTKPFRRRLLQDIARKL